MTRAVREVVVLELKRTGARRERRARRAVGRKTRGDIFVSMCRCMDVCMYVYAGWWFVVWNEVR